MRKITIVFLLAVVALTALPRPVMAQNKAQVMAMAQAELQKRGLDEAEVRARLLENGIDVDNIIVRKKTVGGAIVIEVQYSIILTPVIG